MELVCLGVAVRSALARRQPLDVVSWPGASSRGPRCRPAPGDPNSHSSLHRLHVSCPIPVIHSCARNFTFPPLSLQHSILVEISTGSFQKSPSRRLVLLVDQPALCPQVSRRSDARTLALLRSPTIMASSNKNNYLVYRPYLKKYTKKRNVVS